MSLRLKTAIFVVIVVASNAAGNFMLSRGLRHASPAPSLRAFLSPWVLTGVTLLILWLLSRLTLLSWADLSFVLPVTSIGYLVNVLLGQFFLGEQVTAARWAGASLITLGAVLVGITSPRTPPPERP